MEPSSIDATLPFFYITRPLPQPSHSQYAGTAPRISHANPFPVLRSSFCPLLVCSIESVMASFRQDVNPLERSKGLNNLIARETARPPVSKYNDVHTNLRPLPLRMLSVSGLDEIKFQSAYTLAATEYEKQHSRRSKPLCTL